MTCYPCLRRVTHPISLTLAGTDVILLVPFLLLRMDQEGPQLWQLLPQLRPPLPPDARAAVHIQSVQRRCTAGCQRLHRPVA